MFANLRTRVFFRFGARKKADHRCILPPLLSHSNSRDVYRCDLSFISNSLFICVLVLRPLPCLFISSMSTLLPAICIYTYVYIYIRSLLFNFFRSISRPYTSVSFSPFFSLFYIAEPLFFNGLSRSSDEHVSISARREPRYTARY